VLECRVWWADLNDVRAARVELLDGVESARRDRYLRAEDRDRFTLGVVLSRVALGAALGLPPQRVPLDRTCPKCGRPHGAPRVEGGPYLSVSHSGDRVAVAMSHGGPVGVDVEASGREPGENLAAHVLSPAEAARHGTLDAAGFLTYWTRKEAVLKATGDGLAVPMPDLTVSAPDEPPRLLAWPDRPALPPRITLHTLSPGPAHTACLALLDQPEILVREYPSTPVRWR
jgi:4'-phosphopantetheinyl transferase